MNTFSHAARRIAIGLLLLLAPAVARAAFSATGTPSVSFTASGPGGMKIVGTTSELNVSSASDTVTISVPLGRLTTGISLRDSHMRDKYLQVGTWPNATLVVDRSTLHLPAAGAQAEGDASGAMTIHGQTHPASFHYSSRFDGTTYGVNGTTRVNMRDYGIDVPIYLGVGVKPDVDIAVRFDARDTP